MTRAGMVLPFPARAVLRAAHVLRAPPSTEAARLAASILLVALRRGDAVPPGTVTLLLGLLHQDLDGPFALALADGLAQVCEREVGLYALGLARGVVDAPQRAEVAVRMLAGVHVHVVTLPVLLMIAERASPVAVARLALAVMGSGGVPPKVVALLVEGWRQDEGGEAREAIALVASVPRAALEEARRSLG